MNLNLLDIIIIAILLVTIGLGAYKGLIMSIMDLIRIGVTVVISIFLAPYATKLVRSGTTYYTDIKNSISEALGLQDAVNSISATAQQSFVDNLPLPQFFKDILIQNNNSEIYGKLDVSDFSDYISGYLASFALNLVTFIVLFFIVLIVFNIVVKILDIIAKLPIINRFNKIGGAIFGFATGSLVVFVIIAGFTIISAATDSIDYIAILESSYMAKFFYPSNFVLDALLRFI